MVAMVASSWRDRSAILLDSDRSSGDTPSKMQQMRQLKEILLHRDPALLPEFVSRIAELQADRSSPVRKFLAEMIEKIGLQNMELIPDMVPTLLFFLNDETPAVRRQAITTGTSLFRSVLEKVALQGLYSNGIDDSLKSSWVWMQKFKTAVIPISVQSGIDGVRLLAVRFVEALILLYTPDPNVPLDPPHEAGDGSVFNISWLKGGHPLLNVGDLAMEASQSLHLLLDQLRFPQVKSLSNSIVIVLVNSISSIAKKRPSFYGHILPLLLSLDPASSVIKGAHVAGSHHALKNAFVACLKCTHSSAAPWRARLIEALKAMDSGELVDEAIEPNNISGTISVNVEGSLSRKEDDISSQACSEDNSCLGRKRHMVEENTNLSEGYAFSEKRSRLSTPLFQETMKQSLGSMTSKIGDSEPVQQLVGMFGALVAQGDKAAKSLEILISSISSDLLAELVIANMQYIPTSCPKAEEEEESVPNISYHSSLARNSLAGMQSSTLVNDKFSLSSAFPIIASLFSVQPSASTSIAEIHQIDEEKIVTSAGDYIVPSNVNDAITETSASISATIELNKPEAENGTSVVLFHENAIDRIENLIPGLDSSRSFDEIQESIDASHTSTGELPGISQEHTVSFGGTMTLEISSSDCPTTSETVSPSISVTDASQTTYANSAVISTQYLLPRMSVPNVILTDEEKDQLQKMAFLRIVEAYKQSGVSGGSPVHFSLLTHLGNEFPLELDAWGLLRKHVLSDYLNHEGHELTLRVLYRLYRDVEQDQDFLSSRTASSVYEAFLLTVAEMLRDTFPASDKSLGRLLSEVPYLSEGVLKLLQFLCSPESDGKQDKDLQIGDRVTQGLSAVWNLILLRPSNRDKCLQIALQSAVHHWEEVRMKAIRLVANKLFPMEIISQKIEHFAEENLHSLLDDTTTMESLDGAESSLGLQNDIDLGRPFNEGQTPLDLLNKELTSSGHLTQSTTSSSVSDPQRCMALYFALCTKKHSLLRHIFSIYRSMPKAAKQAVDRHLPILVRTIGSSPELHSIISDPPNGSQSLLMQVLHILTDAAAPSQELILSIRRLYNSKPKDVEILMPVLSLLSKDEVIPILPQLVSLPLDKFQSALSRILQGSPQAGPSLTPAEILIAIHCIDSEKDGVPLKKVMDACSACFEQRQVFSQQVLAKVLNQLVEQIPLPLLFMRTVIQTVGAYPALVDFVMEILSRLISKQIWKNPKLWVGFLKCALQTRPQSFTVLLQLPAVQLENALNKNPVLKQPLVEHANQPNIRSTLPRSTLVVLGLTTDPQQAPSSQSKAVVDTGNSAADAATEVTQESSAAS